MCMIAMLKTLHQQIVDDFLVNVPFFRWETEPESLNDSFKSNLSRIEDKNSFLEFYDDFQSTQQVSTPTSQASQYGNPAGSPTPGRM
jgi:hypothetical protein